jgi:hypothetical protein
MEFSDEIAIVCCKIEKMIVEAIAFSFSMAA